MVHLNHYSSLKADEDTEFNLQNWQIITFLLATMLILEHTNKMCGRNSTEIFCSSVH